MSTLSFSQLEDLWINAGGSPLLAPEMAAIAEAESGGRSDALNNNPSTGDYSVGPWQINYYGRLLAPRSKRYGTPDQLLNAPSRDAQAAVDLASGGAGLSNWSTWKSGAYEHYMPPDAKDIKPSGGASFLQEVGHIASFGIIPAKQFGSPSAKNLAGTVAAPFESIFDSVTNPIESALLRGAFIIGGLLVALVGLFLLARAFGAPMPQLPIASAAAGIVEGRKSAPRRSGDAAIERGEEVTRTGPPERVRSGDRRQLRKNARKRERAERERDASFGEVPF